METLQDFVKKALERLNMKSERPSKTMFVGDLGEEILLEALSMEELNEINRRYSGEPGKMDEYAVFRGSPTIRALSKRLSELEAISEPLDVMKTVSYTHLIICPTSASISGRWRNASAKPSIWGVIAKLRRPLWSITTYLPAV